MTETCAFYSLFLLLPSTAALSPRTTYHYTLAMNITWNISDSRVLLTGDDELWIRSWNPMIRHPEDTLSPVRAKFQAVEHCGEPPMAQNQPADHDDLSGSSSGFPAVRVTRKSYSWLRIAHTKHLLACSWPLSLWKRDPSKYIPQARSLGTYLVSPHFSFDNQNDNITTKNLVIRINYTSTR